MSGLTTRRSHSSEAVAETCGRARTAASGSVRWGSTDLYHAQPDVVADEAAISGVAPVTHAHVNTLGRYELHRQPPPAGQLRPLRQSDENDGVIPAPPLGVSGDKH